MIYANSASDVLLSLWGRAVGDTAPQFWCDLAAQSLASREKKTKDLECDGKIYSMCITPVAEPGYVNIYGYDVSNRKQSEEALRESLLMIEEIINTIPVRVFWKDKDLVYLGCNTIFARDGGLTNSKDVIGKDDFQMVWHDQADLYRDDDRQVIESGSSKI